MTSEADDHANDTNVLLDILVPNVLDVSEIDRMTAGAIVVRVILIGFGTLECWIGFTVVQIKKLDGIRVLPIWSRVLMVAIGLFCILVGVVGNVKMTPR